MNGKFNPKKNLIRAFLSKISTFFQFQKVQKRPLFSPPSYASVSVAEYETVSLYMAKYPWKCFNKLFWLCQGSEYAWSSYMFNRLGLKMPRLLNKPGLWIRHGCIRVRQSSEYVLCLTTSDIPSRSASILSFFWVRM